MHVSHVAEDGRIEEVADHLREVAEMAAEFARPFGAESWAYAAGMAHDIGKYSTEFQNRILCDGHKVDHSTAGAALLDQLGLKLLAYCVAGHHAGLPDGGTTADVEDCPTLRGRLLRAQHGSIPDCAAYAREVELNVPKGPSVLPVSRDREDGAYSLSFLTRMVFSCLVDADFLCTERFMQGEGRDPLSEQSLVDLLGCLKEEVARFYPPTSALNETRCQVLDACIRAASNHPGFFSLTVPTGGGKTYASLLFALEHAVKRDARRVVYAVPYTSIIEQNARVFRDVLGERSVLEHHANFDFDFDEEVESYKSGDAKKALRRASENWDAPIVVTTNVQFFESLYANRTSRCRKLHNIANSVIVLDEAQMVPTKQLLPCLRALIELVANYGCSVVLCTATQPAFNGMLGRKGFAVREIAPAPSELFKKLKRVSYRFDGVLGDDDLAARLADRDQSLCIVNSRKQARRLHELLDGEDSYHLTTLMHPVHRERVLNEIRQRLREGRTCRVVATSLIEAGVDVDFPVVYRALAGVDSMVQAAGRCNREGRQSAEESIVHVFEPADDYALPSDVAQKVAIARSVISEMEGAACESCDIGALEAIDAYFARLYAVREGALDASGVLRDLEGFSLKSLNIPFKRAADDFRMIEEGSRTVVIPDPEIESDILAVKTGFANRSTIRRLSRYAVGVYDGDIKALLRSGKIETLAEDLFVLVDGTCYSDQRGLNLKNEEGKGIFL